MKNVGRKLKSESSKMIRKSKRNSSFREIS